MKRYTQEEFNNLPVDENGVRHCPTGDYTAVKTFGVNCSFGKYCTFGVNCSFSMSCSFGMSCSFDKYCSFSEGCTFGMDCKIENHTLKHSYVISMSGIGKYKRTLYVWDTEDGVYCQAGCFFDTREKFEQAVTEKYHAEHKYIKAVEFLLK